MALFKGTPTPNPFRRIRCRKCLKRLTSRLEAVLRKCGCPKGCIEDVVQSTLARAFQSLKDLGEGRDVPYRLPGDPLVLNKPMPWDWLVETSFGEWHAMTNAGQLPRAIWKRLAAGEFSGEVRDPLSQAERREIEERNAAIHAILRDQVKRLPLKQQQVIRLRCWEGLSNKAAAQQLGIAQSAASTRFSRAIEVLKPSIPKD